MKICVYCERSVKDHATDCPVIEPFPGTPEEAGELLDLFLNPDFQEGLLEQEVEREELQRRRLAEIR
jgi:hypothetical protein